MQALVKGNIDDFIDLELAAAEAAGARVTGSGPEAPPMPGPSEDVEETGLLVETPEGPLEGMKAEVLETDVAFRPGHLPAWKVLTESQLLARKRSALGDCPTENAIQALQLARQPDRSIVNVPGIPLECFDDAEAESTDPAALVLADKQNHADGLAAVPAFSRYFDQAAASAPDGTWEWAPCTVRDYDPATGLFRIDWAMTAAESKYEG